MTTPALTFDAATHRYRAGGRVLCSVTQVLTAAGLIDLSGVPAHRLAWGRERGTACHLAIQFLAEGTLDPQSVDERLEGYVFAFEAFCSAHHADFTPSDVELPLADAVLGVAGTPDLLGSFRGKPAVIDVKTGPMHAGYRVQTAAYQMLLRANGYDCEARYILHLKADGTFQLHPCADRHDANVFRAALLTYQWRRQEGLLP